MATQSSARTAAVGRGEVHWQDEQQQGHHRGQPAEATLRMRNVAHRLRFWRCGDGARGRFRAGTVAFGVQGETGDTGGTGPRHSAGVIHYLFWTRCLLFLLIGFISFLVI